ncbi:hypothetical protein EVAR_29620_1 [Eumeta japonica]|uniref:Uncharacterized protein n=1 Tax=Eumeta variegata TaxID=151549 RepID=A0A4C1VUF0_EUMVA|nr:hypothetical protein EVAR_29620_1 [Eumeta japonica]
MRGSERGQIRDWGFCDRERNKNKNNTRMEMTLFYVQADKTLFITIMKRTHSHNPPIKDREGVASPPVADRVRVEICSEHDASYYNIAMGFLLANESGPRGAGRARRRRHGPAGAAAGAPSHAALGDHRHYSC